MVDSSNLYETWQLVCNQVKGYDSVNPVQVDAFFSRLQPQAISDGFLIVTADTAFIKSQVERRFMTTIQQALKDLFGIDYLVEIEDRPHGRRRRRSAHPDGGPCRDPRARPCPHGTLSRAGASFRERCLRTPASRCRSAARTGPGASHRHDSAHPACSDTVYAGRRSCRSDRCRGVSDDRRRRNRIRRAGPSFAARRQCTPSAQCSQRHRSACFGAHVRNLRRRQLQSLGVFHGRRGSRRAGQEEPQPAVHLRPQRPRQNPPAACGSRTISSQRIPR